jgi:small membrane protein
MSGIQVLLISGVVVVFLYYLARLRSALMDLVLLSLFSGLAIFFILSPDYTSSIAHKLGVGRGADMLFYICILFFLFVILKLFARVRRLEATLTELVRQQAKREAVHTGLQQEEAHNQHS